MSGGSGDHNPKIYTKKQDDIGEDRKMIKEKMIGGLKVIELPPRPEDFCTLCDPVMETDFRLAVFTTFCCWLPLGIVLVVFGIVSIYFAVKAKHAKSEESQKIYSNRSRTISWIGMMLFVVILTMAVIIIATSGVL